jgi:hypothetical protein
LTAKPIPPTFIVLPTGVAPDWWRKQGHSLHPDDLDLVFEASPEVLVVGQGAHGFMKVPDDTLARLRQAGIEAVCLPTPRAVEAYNQRCQQGQRAAAGLHLTC